MLTKIEENERVGVLKSASNFLMAWIICLGSLGATCLADVPQGWSRVSQKEIRLDGSIGSDSLAKFQLVAEGGFARVVLNSNGGMEYAAMRIAQDPRYKEADIVVAEKCFSACANYLAVLGRSLLVDCNSVIGFHGTTLPRYRILPSSAISVLQRIVSKYNSQNVRDWYKNSEHEARELFNSRGVDINLLFYRNHKFLKLFFDIEFDVDTGEYTERLIQYGLWMPSEAQLRAYGLKNLTYCTPTDDADLTARVARLVKDLAKMQNSVWHVGP